MIVSTVVFIATVIEGKSGWCQKLSSKIRTQGGDIFNKQEDRTIFADESKYGNSPNN